MTDPLDNLLTDAFQEAVQTAHDPQAIQTVMARIERRARWRSLGLGAAVITGGIVALLVALPGLQSLLGMVSDLPRPETASATNNIALLLLALAAASPWFVAMLDDRV